jgi:phage protein D
VPDTTPLLTQVYVELDSQPAPAEFVQDLQDVTVENSLHLPDVATLTMNDPLGRWVDDERLGPGRAIKVATRVAQSQQPIFDGEVVELEPEYIPGKQRLVVRAFDRLHRLARGQHVRSFQNVTDSDLIQTIASEVGLQTQVGNTNEVYPYVLQDNETNLEFLRDRALSLGYLLYVEGQTLHCEPHGTQKQTVEVQWGRTLAEFHPRLTTVGQLNSATVRGWDPQKRQDIVGQASNGRGAPRTTDNRTGADLAQNAFHFAAEALVTDQLPNSQAEAQRMAQAVMDRAAADFIVAEGLGTGNPAIRAAGSVSVSGLGNRFNGTYFVTGTTHSYTHDEGYTTRFVVSGHRPTTLLSILRNEADGRDARMPGLAIGIVTDNQDPNGQGRVKVRYPCLSADNASDWARVAAPGNGPDRGMQFVPEVNDEVLVGFEQGDIHHPYVLGGLWNGQDAPPRKTSQVVSSGRVQQRIIKSRSGHTITLDDSDDQPSITIVDKTGKNTIKLDSSNNNLSVSVDGDVALKAQGTISIEGQSVQVKATNDLKLTGTSADLEAQGGLTLKGATADLQASGMATVKGATVSFN